MIEMTVTRNFPNKLQTCFGDIMVYITKVSKNITFADNVRFSNPASTEVKLLSKVIEERQA